MSDLPRTIHVLIYGIHKIGYKHYRDQLLAKLREEHPQWDVNTAYASSVNGAIAYVEHHDDLDLVYFPVELAHCKIPFDMFFYDLKEIGCALSEHPNRPWAVCHRGVNTFIELFVKLLQVAAVDDKLEIAVKKRWQTRFEKLSAPGG